MLKLIFTRTQPSSGDDLMAGENAIGRPARHAPCQRIAAMARPQAASRNRCKCSPPFLSPSAHAGLLSRCAVDLHVARMPRSTVITGSSSRALVAGLARRRRTRVVAGLALGVDAVVASWRSRR